MKYLLSILLIASFSVIRAQEAAEADTLAEAPKAKYHIYVAPSYTGNQFVETIASFAGITVGLTYQNKVEASIYVNTLLDNFRKQIIFPTNFVYDQKNIGLRFQYHLLERAIRPVVGGGAQYSELSWKAEGDLDDLYTDHVFIYDAYIGGVWLVTKILSAQASIGYMIPGELKLVGLDQQDLQGIKIDLAIKVNVFSF